MEKRKLLFYWVFTALLSFGMLFSGMAQVLSFPEMLEMASSLGYPSYFFLILGVWKVLAVVAILAPGFLLLKEWAYAGLFFVMTGAFVSHLASGHTYTELLGPVFQTLFIVGSWYFRPANRRLTAPSILV
jgi:hypothetical protein